MLFLNFYLCFCLGHKEELQHGAGTPGVDREAKDCRNHEVNLNQDLY